MTNNKKQIGLLFGSFNPIHIGHLLIAEGVLNSGLVDEVWMVVSPHNPFKSTEDLAPEIDRLAMVDIAIADNPKIKLCDIELYLPKPSYTYFTLENLYQKYPQFDFRLLMGEDNLSKFHHWREFETILKNASPIVYPRPGTEKGPLHTHPNITLLNMPLMDISATYIRDIIKDKKSLRYLVNEKVVEYINKNNLF